MLLVCDDDLQSGLFSVLPNSCGNSWQKTAMAVESPLVNEAENAAPTARPSAKLWKPSPTITIHAREAILVLPSISFWCEWLWPWPASVWLWLLLWLLSFSWTSESALLLVEPSELSRFFSRWFTSEISGSKSSLESSSRRVSIFRPA